MTDITLGGYPAKTCARAVHNDHTPGLVKPEAPADLQRIFDEGILFETEVTDWMRHAFEAGRTALFVGTDNGPDGWEGNIASTREAMRAGVDVIVNGRLPSINGRSGAPDVLVRSGRGYLPVDIKGHQTLSKMSESPNPRSSVEVSRLVDPIARGVHVGQSNKGGHWRDDVIQLAHYTRMLQDLGMHAGDDELVGGIIGTTDFEPILGDPYGIVWFDLTHADWQTYSASATGNRTKRSPLERYDHEFAFRHKVAEAARRGDELVVPYRIPDCASCLWFDHCAGVVGEDDASFNITIGNLNVREWQYLYPATGRLTIGELAELDVEALAEGFTTQSAGTQSPEKRLSNVVRRARMVRDDIDIEPLSGHEWAAPPSADVEIDFDIEWDYDGRIYQWGLRIRDDQDDATARYVPDLVTFDELDEDAEAALADRFADALAAAINEADVLGRTWAIFHWSDPEVSRTAKFTRIAQLLDNPRRHDLYQWFQRHYFGREGSSLKPVATALGFTWSVEDAGGLYSMEQIEVARGTGPEADRAREWCLGYNESDVAAQAAIRDALADRAAP